MTLSILEGGNFNFIYDRLETDDNLTMLLIWIEESMKSKQKSRKRPTCCVEYFRREEMHSHVPICSQMNEQISSGYTWKP